jgi:uncharacterized protein with NAD-binding domain and iron-sulfur cluster
VTARQKVAILGGGVSSMVAAWELTRTPALRARYEVTVHQLGWRLGGKGASGRNAAHHQRIEEHGLHVWFGFYDNAFRVMRDCYAELGRARGTPLAGWRDAFKPCSDIVLYERFGGAWRGRGFQIPTNELTPGTTVPMPDFWVIAHEVMSWALQSWKALRPGRPPIRRRSAWPLRLPFALDHLLAGAGARLWHAAGLHPEPRLRVARILAMQRCERALEGELELAYRMVFRALLRTFKRWLWTEVVEPRLDDDEVRLFFTMFDAGTAVLEGVLADELIERGFDTVNDEEFRSWLQRHGAFPLTVEGSPLVRGWYDLAFSYDGGDIGRPAMAAGTAIHGVLRLLFTYRGAFCWKMQAGMGDTVFAPLYEVLRRRGVRFEFFHWITRLGLSADQRSVDTIELIPQVALTGAEYRPLVTVGGLPCWPSEPLWDQIAGGAGLADRHVNLEHERNPGDAPALTLRRGDDFDLVVLGISVGALPEICHELIGDEGNPAFRAMLEHSRTVMTQAFQLWLDRPLDQLGWRFPPGAAMTGYVEPLDTYADMSHLLPREDWPERELVRHLAYFCGVLRDEEDDTQQAASDRARRNAISFLERSAGGLWPQAARRDGALDWERLVDPGGGRECERFDSQFWVANFQATERYVLTPPGSVKYRLGAHESGYANLFLTGDWIRTGMDAGCVEAAVMAGMQASRAICGTPRRIAGEDRSWLAGRGT